MTETWYLLYAGTTADGMGDGNYCGRTTDKEIAKKHWEEWGKVVAVTDTKHRRIGFDYEWEKYV
jgi:hypothetical protein